MREPPTLFGGLRFRPPHLRLCFGRLSFGEALLALGAPTARDMRWRVTACEAIGADKALGRARAAIFSIMIELDPILMLHQYKHHQGREQAGPEREADDHKDKDIIQVRIPRCTTSSHRRTAGFAVQRTISPRAPRL